MMHRCRVQHIFITHVLYSPTIQPVYPLLHLGLPWDVIRRLTDCDSTCCTSDMNEAENVVLPSGGLELGPQSLPVAHHSRDSVVQTQGKRSKLLDPTQKAELVDSTRLRESR